MSQSSERSQCSDGASEARFAMSVKSGNGGVCSDALVVIEHVVYIYRSG